MSRTPLEEWISRKIGLEKKELTREAIAQYQLARIREVVALVKGKSAFYRKRLSPVNPDEIGDYGCFSRLPFTFPRHIREDPQSFVCKSQGEIERIVTLRSSGTTGPPKRIYFTKEDQELTIDFFKPVSYTHLDVYKRQGEARPGADQEASSPDSPPLPANCR